MVFVVFFMFRGKKASAVGNSIFRDYYSLKINLGIVISEKMQVEIGENFFRLGFSLNLNPDLLTASLKEGQRRNTYQIFLH